MNKYIYKVESSQKLSKFLFSLGLKNSQISLLFKNKDVRVDGVKKTCDEMLSVGQEVIFFLKEEIDKKFTIFYEDENIIVVNKDAGIEATGQASVEEKLNCFAVHRLDRNTKGLLVMAKNEEVKNCLVDAFKENLVTKKYLCEVVGKTNFKNEFCEAYLFKDAKLSKTYVYKEPRAGTVKIKTLFNTIKSSNETSIVECVLLTGKTHQIRSHLAFLGHPILGDGKYGSNDDNKKFKEKTQKLFCYYITFKCLKGKLEYLNNKEFVQFPNWFRGY